MAFQSVSAIATSSISATVTVTKPTGLIAGDLMVAHLVRSDNDTTARDFSRSGWTVLYNTNDNDGVNSWTNCVLYKVADSGDAAASNFAFTLSSTGDFLAGVIYRIDGYSPSAPINASSSILVQNSAAPVFASTITPTFANCLFLFLAYSKGSTTSISNQAIVTSNPSWTEDYDGSIGAANQIMSGAHATRPETTATGNASFTADSGAGTTDNALILIAIKPLQSVTYAATEFSLSDSIQAPAIAGGALISASVVVLSPSLQAPQRNDEALVTTQKKHNATGVVNQTKS